MKTRTDTWFDRQLAHARAAIAEADRIHTPEEVAAADVALQAYARGTHPQAPLPLSDAAPTNATRSAT